MNIIVIGGTGHIGTFLIPRLVQAGHQVTVVSRQRKIPYQGHDAWQQVRLITMDRPQMEQEGTFGRAIADLSPEVVIDLICFRPESAYDLVSALRGDLSHFIHCGTMWVHGHKVQIPSEEWHVRRPLGEYGKLKAEIERYLLDEAGKLFPVTVLHPGHIVGPGWTPVNPVGNFDASAFTKLATGQELLFPTLGMETLHHVHADDVALAFMQVLENGRSAAGESFHVLSENAITCRGYAEEVAAWYGRQAAWRFVSWDEFRHAVPDEDAQSTWDHLSHSSVGSIEKAKRLLNYAPRYTSLQAIKQAIASLPSHLPFPGGTSIL